MDIEILNYLRLNVVDVVLVLISTVLIVVIAKKFFWNYAKDYLDGRQQFVTNQLEETSMKLQESTTINKQAKDELLSVRRQANDIIDQAKQAATQEAKEIKKSSMESAASIKEKALSDIRQQKIKAIEEMKDEMGEIALLTASKIVKRELDDDTQKAYVKEFIEEVDKH